MLAALPPSNDGLELPSAYPPSQTLKGKGCVTVEALPPSTTGVGTGCSRNSGIMETLSHGLDMLLTTR